MSVAAQLAISIPVGYLLGSLPWAYLAGRLNGVNVGELDTRIAGAANIFRNVGRPWGAAVFTGDVAKGLAAVAIAKALGADDALALPAGAAAVAGHWVPLFGRFPGGVGLATAVGVSIGMVWIPGVVATAFGLLVIAVLRNTGVGGGLGFTFYLIFALLRGDDPLVVGLSVGLAAMVLAKAKLRRIERA